MFRRLCSMYRGFWYICLGGEQRLEAEDRVRPGAQNLPAGHAQLFWLCFPEFRPVTSPVSYSCLLGPLARSQALSLQRPLLLWGSPRDTV